MRKAKRFSSREKQVFLVGFSLTFPRSPRISKNRLNTSLVGMTISTNVDSSNDQTYVRKVQLCLFAKNVGNWVEMDMSFGRTSIQGTFESSEFFCQND